MYMGVKYHFLKITNNKNLDEFDIIFTRLRNYNTKISSFRSQYKDYQRGFVKYKKIFDLIAKDHSWYRVYHQYFDDDVSLEDLEEVRNRLIFWYKNKISKNMSVDI